MSTTQNLPISFTYGNAISLGTQGPEAPQAHDPSLKCSIRMLMFFLAALRQSGENVTGSLTRTGSSYSATTIPGRRVGTPSFEHYPAQNSLLLPPNPLSRKCPWPRPS